MCVISDAKQPVAIAGVMGGAETEISLETTDVLIESAQFAPLPVRSAARALVLGSLRHIDLNVVLTQLL